MNMLDELIPLLNNMQEIMARRANKYRRGEIDDDLRELEKSIHLANGIILQRKEQ